MSGAAAHEIANLLGLREPQGEPLSAFALIRQIDDGLSVAALQAVADKVAPDDRSFVFRLMPRATLERRKRSQRLTPDEGGKVARLARVWAAAIDVWQDDVAARGFLSRPHSLLEGRKPIDVVLGNEIGATLVEDILGRLKYGTAA